MVFLKMTLPTLANQLVSCVLRSGPQVWWGYNIVILRHTETLINIIYSVWSLISVSTTSYRQHYTPCLSCY